MSAPLSSICLFAALLFCGIQSAWSDPSPPPITTVAQALALKPADLEKQPSARIEGTIVYNEPTAFLTFIHDDTGSMYVAEGSASGLKMGDRVRIDGVITAGRVNNMLSGRHRTPPHVQILGHGPLPVAADCDTARLFDATYDAQWIRLKGIVQDVERSNDRASINLDVEGQNFHALIPGFPEDRNLPDYLRGLPVTVSGVFGTNSNTSGHFDSTALLVPSQEQVVIDPTFLDAQFSEPAKDYTDLFVPGPRGGPRVHVHGVATLVRPLHGFFMVVGEEHHWTGNVWVQTEQPLPLVTNQIVDVIALPERSGGRPQLHDAVVRLGPLTPRRSASALPLNATDLWEFQGTLVYVDGHLLEQQRGLAEDSLLVLDGAGRVICARLPIGPHGERVREYQKGSRLRVAGICVSRTPEGAQPYSCQFWLRDLADVTLLAPPPWWTPERVLYALAAVFGIALLALGWAGLLRRQVRQQTEIIGRQLQRETLHEERTRIAREFHDTFEQHLAGLNMQLDALAAQTKDAPPETHRLLDLAREMVRHSRDEARHAIWELRAPVLAEGNFTSVLDAKLRPVAERAHLQLDISAATDCPTALPLRVENHLLRVAQEAFTNAVKHAAATTVEVRMHSGSDSSVVLSIRDDGCGFDPGVSMDANNGHFGLCGMRERAARMNGTLEVASAPGAGTKITVRLPLAGDRNEARGL